MASPKRDPRWDNAKFLLILLVVFGHAVEQACGLYAPDRSLFLFIYSFHMPAFLFVSGLFAKRTVQSDTYNWRKLVPYLFVWVVLSFYRDLSLHIRKPSHGFSLYDQNKISWFMLALFACYSIAWLLRKVPAKYVLPGSFIIGLAVGYVPFISEGFALSRIIVFFPFFYAGYALDREKFAAFLDRKPVRIAGASLFTLWLVLCFVLEKHVYLLRRLFTGQNNYDELPAALDSPVEMLYRLLAYSISILAVLAFFTLVPRVSIPHLTTMGSRTLSVYFWHLPVLDVILHLGFMQAGMKVNFALQITIAVLLTAALTALFSWKPFTVPLNWMLNPWSDLEKGWKKLKEKKSSP